MKVAVTGARGHVGNALCRELDSNGIEVTALVHKDENDLHKIGVRIVKGDLLDKTSLEMLCQDADVVYHLAAKISIDERAKDQVYRTIPPFQYSNLPSLQSSIIPTFQSSNIPTFQSSIIPPFHHSFIPVFHHSIYLIFPAFYTTGSEKRYLT